MTPPRRPRTGIRRDGGVRVIRAHEVRYPSVETPHAPDRCGRPAGDGRTLRPARDTGLALDGRRGREARRRSTTQRRHTFFTILAVLILGALALGWQYASDRQAASQPLSAAASASRPSGGASAGGTDAPVVNAVPVQPTPIFATYGKLKVHLPVRVKSLTEVGFHQASYGYALHMKSPLPDADMVDAKHDKSTHRDKSTQAGGASVRLVGEVLRMWRNRPGKPDSAADVGASPGSDVFSPVTGTVVKVKRFKLYGKYDDYEIHIQPAGHPKIDCVLIHVSDVSCKPGDRVLGGVTRIAAVRKLDPRVGPQLKQFTRNGGFHTHMQLNDATDPTYKGLKGAIKVDPNAPLVTQKSPVQ